MTFPLVKFNGGTPSNANFFVRIKGKKMLKKEEEKSGIQITGPSSHLLPSLLILFLFLWFFSCYSFP